MSNRKIYSKKKAKIGNAFPKVPDVAFDAPPSQFPIHNNGNKLSTILPASPLRARNDNTNNNLVSSSPYSPTKTQLLIVQGRENSPSKQNNARGIEDYKSFEI